MPEGEGRTPEPWYQVILDFLRTGILLGDPPVANKIKRQSLRYTLLDIVLYHVPFYHYELETLGGHQVPWSWNTCHLRKYYV
ncbi:hypothetical protein LIER_31829 [Lithospermum erythrorhizon]|uniref:Uncharacterized protein n=1 Tax=Lithospermum erythrorhizon TaxID=34254 RepID=A0AAV3RY23_LITER